MFVFKLVLLLLVLFILINLGRAMFEMVRGSDDDEDNAEPDDKPMSFYLGRRVFLSAFAIILLIAALLSGFIEPHGRPY